MNSTIGIRIKKYREELGLTLPELAQKAGISKGYLWQLEEGEMSNPTMETLLKIAKALDKTISELTIGEPIVRPVNNQEITELPESLKKFVERRDKIGEPLSNDDIAMLARIQYRGKRPSTVEDWEMLFMAIRNVSKKK